MLKKTQLLNNVNIKDTYLLRKTLKSKEETEMHKETGFIENGNLGTPCGNPRVLPPLERKPSKRKKKKKKRRITPQSSMDADDGGFFNAAYSNSNPNLDHVGQDVYAE